MNTIYMDNAATSFPKPASVYEAVDYFNRHLGGNPGRGSHQATLRAGTVVLEARENLAQLFNIADSAQIAFTLNVTDALNTALKGILRPGDHVVSTSMEHNSVARPLYRLAQEGVEWTAVPCAADGSLDPENIRQAIRPNTRMICMLHASNLTGTIMPVKEVGKIAREHEVLFLLDAAQTAGILPVDVIEQNIDLLAFTGHKALMGPQGTGGLYVRPGLYVRTLKEGGTGALSEHLEHPDFMPDHLESGTPNTPGIAGLLAGVRFVMETGLEAIRQRELQTTRLLMDGLADVSGITLYGPADIHLRTAVIPFNIAGIDCGELSLHLDHEFGIITRAGLHCAPLAHRTIGTLEAGACRISPGFFTTEREVEAVIRAVAQIARQALAG